MANNVKNARTLAYPSCLFANQVNGFMPAFLLPAMGMSTEKLYARRSDSM